MCAMTEYALCGQRFLSVHAEKWGKFTVLALFWIIFSQHFLHIAVAALWLEARAQAVGGIHSNYDERKGSTHTLPSRQHNSSTETFQLNDTERKRTF